ncbi:MAG TPA: site-specific integrase, partial [Anaerolineae bacterium]|nr:site-specific integrase [Anaerolineae bacterium]
LQQAQFSSTAAEIESLLDSWCTELAWKGVEYERIALRQVRVGNKARAAILRLMAYRGEPSPRAALWPAYDLQGCECGALSVHGLQTALVRLGRAAGVSPCGPHRFRRTFALWRLRDGMDLHSLRLLMGHSSLTVLQRYLALTGEDVERAHAAHSPADKLL